MTQRRKLAFRHSGRSCINWAGSTAATCRSRSNGRVVPVAVIMAVGVNADGRREVLGMDIGPSEAETFWTAFLRKLARRGLRGCEARRLRRSRGHQGGGLEGAQCHLAALSRAL